ncbi:MAG: hypothetical protein CVU05_08360 [Bacteroidetes bacterium HGW-Bacteroidetes-21]|jgi:uncharacterized protein YqgV (UPF0045/DUF77 family)|nr:MAG: hypothetical protein CVU05_08360 [Bacteroidetes bacterium HGW-Bacteroidetes-21]
MKNSIVNVAIQVLPVSKTKHPYAIVDTAIEVIQKSGLTYRVCPFETVVEGPFAQVMSLIEEIHHACYADGTENMMCYVKIQSNASGTVSIGDKMDKYD